MGGLACIVAEVGEMSLRELMETVAEVRASIALYQTELTLSTEAGDQDGIDFSHEMLQLCEDRIACLDRMISRQRSERLEVIRALSLFEEVEEERRRSKLEADPGLLGRCFDMLQKCLGYGDARARSGGYQHLHQQ